MFSNRVSVSRFADYVVSCAIPTTAEPQMTAPSSKATMANIITGFLPKMSANLPYTGAIAVDERRSVDMHQQGKENYQKLLSKTSVWPYTQ